MAENQPALAGDIVRHVPLPSGGWAEYRDPATIRAKDKRQIIRAIENPDRAAAASLDITEGVVCMFVERWQIPYLPDAPLPREMPSILGELTIGDYDALIDAARPALAIFFPTSTPDDAGKPGSPTQPASA
jgi:hypothetical protein